MTKNTIGVIRLTFDMHAAENGGHMLTSRDIANFTLFLNDDDPAAITGLLKPALDLRLKLEYDFTLKRLLADIRDEESGKVLYVTAMPN